ncbi:stage II sporulation protein P [Metabacillus halosaccharovorans]|uniref:stage II sporulation protein P n=1 Tax=Metabacillus halosaccharovorans TaxID=930124 RepID=UPI001C1FEA84|nr:stage II sporulation protein P [Metabacillus halosaccharovorans]MBU7593648.1 stage II sporulation protein P [Metabacillus halosaccharovorans]
MKRTTTSRNMIVTLNGTSIKKGVVISFIVLVITFLLSGILTSLKPEYRLTSSSIHDLTKHIDSEAFLQLLGAENRYFVSAMPEKAEPIKLSSIMFKVATSINPDDPRSLLGRELPGFSLFDSEIVVAGDGTNYTNMPYESPPPTEVLLQEREASIDKNDVVNADDGEPKTPPALTTGDKKVVYIYNTHNTESYLPLLEGEDDPNRAIHSKANVTMVSELLGKALKEEGIGSQVETTDIQDNLKQKGWNYAKSYTASRPVVQSAMASNQDLTYMIDIHRDSQRKDVTTIKIGDKSYAKLAFVIGGDNPTAEKNEQLAKDLHDLLQEKYPGLSRGIFEQGGKGYNGVYNQDLSNNAMLLEFGGVDNSLDELKNTIAAVADVFSEYYWQAEKVNGETSSEKK